MSERDGYAPGVPCWVDTWQPDPEAAAGFYTQLFGWEAEEPSPTESDGKHYMCRLRGRDVAAIAGPPPEGAPAAWGTYVWVEDADRTAAKATDAGGSVLVGPFDSYDGGRMAIVADPAGAVIGVWRPGAHKGAQLVNEAGAWSMSSLNTRDPEGAKAFYGAVFGWSTSSFDLGGSEIKMWHVPGYVGGEPLQPVPRDVVATMAPIGDQSPDDVPPHWGVDFWVDDVDGTAEKAADLGGKVLAPPYDVPNTPLRQAMLADPQGAAFSVTKVIVRGG
jgi:predicted enzyme related to lactoylglutathione lyase